MSAKQTKIMPKLDVSSWSHAFEDDESASRTSRKYLKPKDIIAATKSIIAGEVEVDEEEITIKRMLLMFRQDKVEIKNIPDDVYIDKIKKRVAYFKPVYAMCEIEGEKEMTIVEIDQFDSFFATDNWVISVTISFKTKLDSRHKINILAISGVEKEFNGIKYNPVMIYYDKDQKEFLDSLVTV